MPKQVSIKAWELQLAMRLISSETLAGLCLLAMLLPWLRLLSAGLKHCAKKTGSYAAVQQGKESRTISPYNGWLNATNKYGQRL